MWPRGDAGHMRWQVVVCCCLCVLAVGCIGPLSASQPTSYNATVVGVVDGDTIDVRLSDGREERVRLLGIDTPEVHVRTDPAEYPGVPNTTAARACLRVVGENASRFVEDRLATGRVRLDIDPQADRRGGYGRLLAYVFVGDTHLNRELVARGYARVYETDFSRRDAFERAQQGAMTEGHGIWRCRT